MPTETYGDIMRRAWGIVRSNRAIWWMALIAVLCGRIGGGGGGGNINLPSNFGSPDSNTPDLTNPFGRLPEIGTIIAIAVVVALVVLLLSLIFWVLGWRAMAGLIHAAASADHGEPLRFGEAWRRGRTALRTLLVTDILLALPVFALVLVMGGIGFAIVASSVAGSDAPEPSAILGRIIPLLLCLLPFFLILLLYSIVVRLVLEYSSRAAVLEGLGARASIRRGWQVLRSATARALGTWLLGGGLFFAVGLALVIPLFVVFGVAVVGAVGGTQPSVALLAGAGIVILLILLLGVVLTTVVGAFMSVLWTLVYGRAPAVAAQTPVTTPLQ